MNIEEIRQKYAFDASLEEKNKRYLESFKRQGVAIVNSLPKGWKFIEGATTAPDGYRWASNGESRFGGKYKHCLVKVR